MNLNEQTYWKIDDYLKNRSEGNVLNNFQKEIENNTSLQEEIDLHRIANKLVIENRLLAAKQTSLSIQKASKERLFYQKIAIGTAIVLSLAIAFYSIIKSPTENQKNLIQPSEEVTSSNNTEITITAGGTQAIFTAIASIIHPNEEAIIFDPAYDCYAPTVRAFGGLVKAFLKVGR